ncbi:MAG: ABC transporter permease, partial [Planctomycetota bacterium]
MKRLARIPGLPLLVKELVEQAARRRTYIVRVVYAVLLFAAFAVFFHGEVATRGMSYQMLGVGREMFEFLLGVQLVGVYVFLPAMMAGVITYEKERRSLELLFITDLGPWEIVLQKLGGRLLPMFTFLLLSLPLMAVTYAFGGVESGFLALGAYVLLTTCVQIGTFALMMSAYFRTSSEAILATYAGGIGLFGVMGIITAIVAEMSMGLGPAQIVPMVSIAPFFLLVFRSSGAPFSMPLAAHLLPWAWTALFLLGARRFLLTRASLHGKKRW